MESTNNTMANVTLKRRFTEKRYSSEVCHRTTEQKPKLCRASPLYAALFLFVFFPFTLYSADLSGNGLLAAELEKLEQESSAPGGKREALKSMARLYQLSGNREKALDAWKGAFEAVPSEPDYGALLEVSKLLSSMGEYEKAEAELRGIPSGVEAGTSREARFLMALLGAFGRGDTNELAVLATDPVYISRRAEIYYTLWKISGVESWKAKLIAEYPQSPEALMTGVPQKVSAAPTPQWLLFPGPGEAGPALRESAARTSPPAAAAVVAEKDAAFLQAGLFGREANARAMTERLIKAGFKAQINKREIRGTEYWAVMVDSGGNSNRTLLELKNSGFEAFPVF